MGLTNYFVIANYDIIPPIEMIDYYDIMISSWVARCQMVSNACG